MAPKKHKNAPKTPKRTPKTTKVVEKTTKMCKNGIMKEEKKTKRKKRSPRATKAQVELLVLGIIECLIAQMSRAQIVRFISSQPVIDEITKRKIDKMPAAQKREFVKNLRQWDICGKQIDNYIKRARGQLLAEMKPKLDEMRTDAYLTLRKIIQDTMMLKDYRTTMTAIKQIAELFGLEAPQKVAINAEVKHKNLDVSKLTDEQLEQLEELLLMAKPDEEEK
jgi:hypothetical protein